MQRRIIHTPDGDRVINIDMGLADRFADADAAAARGNTLLLEGLHARLGALVARRTLSDARELERKIRDEMDELRGGLNIGQAATLRGGMAPELRARIFQQIVAQLDAKGAELRAASLEVAAKSPGFSDPTAAFTSVTAPPVAPTWSDQSGGLYAYSNRFWADAARAAQAPEGTVRVSAPFPGAPLNRGATVAEVVPGGQPDAIIQGTVVNE